jgi:hypothetical protein
MKISFLVLFFCLILTSSGFSQEKKWQLGLFPFFDNTEFGGSKVQIPQTMSGVLFFPEMGLSWDSIHRVSVGLDFLHEFGSAKAIDYFYPTVYYEMNSRPFRFYMGAFPRRYVIEKYPRIFFQDSISYYRPNINGLFWEYYKRQDFINVWLDWTSRQSPSMHEAFFMGFSGRYNMGILFFQHFGYMFHFAGKMNPVVREPLHDNGIFYTSAGLDLSGKTVLNKLEINGGWVIGLERSRAENAGWIAMNGILVEARIEYKIIGLFNSFYTGRGQMYFYSTHGNELYWGDPVYRAKTYNRSDFYLNFFNNKVVSTKFIYSLHFLENRMYHEQSLKITFNLNNY